MGRDTKTKKYFRIIDNKGRITIPQAIRKELSLYPGETVAIYLAGEKSVFEKASHQLICDCCGCYGEIVVLKQLALCTKCLDVIVKKGSKVLKDKNSK